MYYQKKHRRLKTDGNKLFRELWGLALLFLSIFLLLSLITYSPTDPSLNQKVGQNYEIQNQAGLVGAYLAGFFVDMFGFGSLVWPVFFLLGSLSCFFPAIRPAWWRWAGFFLFFLCFISWSQIQWAQTHVSLFQIHGGGFVGKLLFSLGRSMFKIKGSFIFWLFCLLLAFQLSTGISWRTAGRKIKPRIVDFYYKYRERIARAQKRREEKNLTKPDASGQEKKVVQKKDPEPEEEGPPILTPFTSKPAKTAPVANVRKYVLPPVSLLAPVQESRSKLTKEEIEDFSTRLEESLSDFGVNGEVQRVQPGPVVTMFEFKPAPGIKISKIAGLSDDLALALKALAVRIVAPLPGKDTVGIEVPNKERETVYLREIIDTESFSKTTYKLPIALGKDIQGQPRIADLSRMPHLLVAGATGAGKSVCLNSIILSLLFSSDPERLKLLLIDPKRIELATYNSLPHLVHPVVTDMSLAKNALDWAVHEMEQRYEAMAELGVRNIDGYNEKLKKMAAPPAEAKLEHQHMPYLVIIVDELADLMLTAAKEVEVSIVRLAQLARAAGMHIILATQRPSVDVVTGLIKANFPSRIAFQVSSKHDSRTILDTVGAEYLLGMGDMLYKGSAGKIHRIHGTYVNEDEISHMITFWEKKSSPSFLADFQEWKKERGSGSPGDKGNDVVDDPMYSEAVDFITEQGKASISMIQRRFRIGFNKAARFIEQMEQDGLIGPQEGSKPRQVLAKR